MPSVKHLGAAVALAMALAGTCACSAPLPDEPEQAQIETALDVDLGSLDVKGYDAEGLEVTAVTLDATSVNEIADGGVATSSDTFEAANDYVAVEGAYTIEWTLAEDGSTWQKGSVEAEITKTKVLAGPSLEAAQEIVRTNYDEISEAYGLYEQYMTEQPYTSDSLTATGVTFDEGTQEAVVAVDVTPRFPIYTPGEGTVTLRAGDAGWEYVSAATESEFSDSIVGTWVGTATNLENTALDMSSGDLADFVNTDYEGTTCKLVVTSAEWGPLASTPSVFTFQYDGEIYGSNLEGTSTPKAWNPVFVYDDGRYEGDAGICLLVGENTYNRAGDKVLVSFYAFEDKAPELTFEYVYTPDMTQVKATFTLERVS